MIDEKKLLELENKIKEKESFLETKEFDNEKPSKKKELIEEWLKLKLERNKIVKYPLAERTKLQIISKNLNFADDVNELRATNRVAYEKLKKKAKKLFKKKGLTK